MNSSPDNQTVPIWQGVLYGGAAAICFYLGYEFKGLSFLLIGYLFCLIEISRLATTRQAFYTGLATGFVSVAPQLTCFWTIFGQGAIALWIILAIWVGLFVALVRLCRLRFNLWAALLIPVIWTGLEYFRSELYYLRFSWVNVGYAFSGSLPAPVFHWLGMYGVGLAAAAIAALVSIPRKMPARLMALAPALAICGAMLVLPGSRNSTTSTKQISRAVSVAGVQLEFPTEDEVMVALDKLLKKTPQAALLVLGEYTFDCVIPGRVKDWCKEHQRYLIVGGTEPVGKKNFYDTVFVVGTNGQVVFQQAKSVPIQFFKDGLPAREHGVWESPWGRIGLCVCYDLSYTRVTDRLIQLGAQAIIVPTMDVADWGRRQHELHALVAPVRAAEYGIPIFRLASSGISQVVNADGVEIARAGFPGQREMISGTISLNHTGSRPWDRWFAPFNSVATGCLIIWLCVGKRLHNRQTSHRPNFEGEKYHETSSRL